MAETRPAGLCHSADGGLRGSSRHLPANHLPARGGAQYRRTDPGTQRDSQYTRCQAHLRYAAPSLLQRAAAPANRGEMTMIPDLRTWTREEMMKRVTFQKPEGVLSGQS